MRSLSLTAQAAALAASWLAVAVGAGFDAWLVVGPSVVERSTFCNSPSPAVVATIMAVPVVIPLATAVGATVVLRLAPERSPGARRVRRSATAALIVGGLSVGAVFVIGFIQFTAGVWCY